MPATYKNYALLSIFDKTGLEEVARRLIKLGYTILSSGGTAKHLREHAIEVIEVSELTGYDAVLGHRVVTLAPQIHGGLLATAEMEGELRSLSWPRIGFLYVTFYPLAEELRREGATFASCLEKTDIGGPAMVRSANKGGETVVLADPTKDLLEATLKWIEADMPKKKGTMRRLRMFAEVTVAAYTSLSARVHTQFCSSEESSDSAI